MYPKDYNENLKYRDNVITKAQKDKELRSLLMAKCKEDIVFFLNVFCWTFDPRKEESHLPFITYEFQDTHLHKMVECAEKGEDFVFDKSRDMGASWMAVGFQVWALLFKQWSVLYGSYKEDYVDEKGNLDSNFERVRYVMEKLPKWMKPNDLVDKYMGISSNKLGCDISGDSGMNFGTGGRRRVVLMDEFSYWQNDKTAYRKTRDVTNCRIIWGTPNGRFNVFGKMMTNHQEYRHIKMLKDSILWRKHPEKTQKWYENEKLRRTAFDMAVEIDLSYDMSVQGAVYRDFQNMVTFNPVQYNPQLKTYTSWDFGRDMTAIIWWQKDINTNELFIIDSFQKSAAQMPSIEVDFFAAFITGEPAQGWEYNQMEMDLIEKHRPWRNSYTGHYGDPYNSDSKTINTSSSIKDILSKHNIYISFNRESSLEERIRKTITSLKRITIDDSQSDLIMAMQQSRYPALKEGGEATKEKTKPIHDANSHYRTAFEYFIDNEPSLRLSTAKRSGPNKFEIYE